MGHGEMVFTVKFLSLPLASVAGVSPVTTRMLTALITKVKLSRRVVSVELRGKLIVSVKAWRPDDNSVVKKEEVFSPLKRGLSFCTLQISSCKMEVSVAWSLSSSTPVSASVL